MLMRIRRKPTPQKGNVNSVTRKKERGQEKDRKGLEESFSERG